MAIGRGGLYIAKISNMKSMLKARRREREQQESNSCKEVVNGTQSHTYPVHHSSVFDTKRDELNRSVCDGGGGLL